MPLPRTRWRLPGWVPGLIRSVTGGPSSVGHVDVGAERRLGERHRHAHREVVAAAAEARVRRDVDLDEQVAGGSAVAARARRGP